MLAELAGPARGKPGRALGWIKPDFPIETRPGPAAPQYAAQGTAFSWLFEPLALLPAGGATGALPASATRLAQGLSCSGPVWVKASRPASGAATVPSATAAPARSAMAVLFTPTSGSLKVPSTYSG